MLNLARWRYRDNLRQYVALLGGLAALCATGCDSGPRRMHVWGDITFDAAPVTEGTIILTPIASTPGPSTGASIKDGKYDIPAAGGPFPGGVYRVDITALRKTGKKIPSFMVNAPEFELVENFVPARYNRQSTLQVTISDNAEKNRFDFPLSTTAGR